MSTSHIPILTKQITLSSSEVLSLNSTPQELIAAPASGEAIELVSAVGQIRFNSASYATNLELQLLANGAGTEQLENIDLLGAGSSTIEKFSPVEGGILLKGTRIMVQVASGDPGSGDSPLDIEVSYRIVYNLP